MSDVSWFQIYIVVLTALALVLLLALVLVIIFKMSRMANKLDDISENATRFVRMGMNYFKQKK